MTQENQNLLTPYDNLLIQHGEQVHQVIKDMNNCRLEDIRKACASDIEPLLNLFHGSSPTKKKEELIVFLKLLPEYKSSDPDVLYRRLKALKERIRVTEGSSDLYFYALRKYRSTTSENEE